MPQIFLLASWTQHRMWYALPLVVVVSLVWAATRHEQMWPILEHAARFAAWIVGFMVTVYVVLRIISAFL